MPLTGSLMVASVLSVPTSDLVEADPDLPRVLGVLLRPPAEPSGVGVREVEREVGRVHDLLGDVADVSVQSIVAVQERYPHCRTGLPAREVGDDELQAVPTGRHGPPPGVTHLQRGNRLIR
jgi:hypothetical protein